MSVNWVRDIENLHEKFGFHEKIAEFDKETLYEMLLFRFRFLEEEMKEIEEAIESGNSEEIVDGLIDLCVVSIGTLDLFQVDSHKAWNAIHKANMKKERGIKDGRPNPLGLPDLMKPKGWKSPSHKGNHGLLSKIEDI